MTLADVIAAIAKVIVALVFPPLLLGLIARTKAYFAGRVGPPLLQPYYDIHKLLRKDTVISRTTSWVFLAGPAVDVDRDIDTVRKPG